MAHSWQPKRWRFYSEKIKTQWQMEYTWLSWKLKNIHKTQRNYCPRQLIWHLRSNVVILVHFNNSWFRQRDGKPGTELSKNYSARRCSLHWYTFTLLVRNINGDMSFWTVIMSGMRSGHLTGTSLPPGPLLQTPRIDWSSVSLKLVLQEE
jgi:hypothetical protein